MTNSFNVSGRIVRDVELRTTQSGKSVTTVTIANETGWGDNKKTHFIDVVLFEKKAEYAERYGKKGSFAEVTGELHIRKYTDKNGNNRIAPEVQNVINFSLILTGERNTDASKGDDFTEVTDSEDLPFN